MSLVEKVTPWWRLGSGAGDRSLAQDVVAWLFSLVIHLTALVVLAYLTLLLPIQKNVLLSSLPVELDDEPLPQEFHYSPDAQEHIGALGTSGVAGAAANRDDRSPKSRTLRTTSIRPRRWAKLPSRSSTARCSKVRTSPKT